MNMRYVFWITLFSLSLLGCKGTNLGDSVQIGDSVSDGGGGDQNPTPTIETTETPLILSTTPASPDLSQTPTINGTSEANAAIVIYSDSSCTTSVESGTADGTGNFAITLSSAVDGGSETTYYATAQVSGENVSACSVSNVTYKSTAIRPGLAFLTGTQTTAPANATQLNQGTAYALQWSSSEVDSNYFSHSTMASSEQLTVLRSGNYFISVTIPLIMTAGSMRPVVRMEVRVNGVLYPGAIGESSYIRNDGSTGNSESSCHVAIYLESLSVNDRVEVFVQETAGDNGSEVVNVSSVASLYVEFVNASRSVFTGTATRTVGSTDINNAGASPFEWTESLKSADYTHDDVTNPENITLVNGGNYMLNVNVPINSGGTRNSPKVLVKLNGVTVSGGQASQGYIRNDSGHNDSSIHWSGYIVANPGDVLTVTSEEEANTGSVTVNSVASINIERLGSTSNVIALRGRDLDTGTDWNAAGTNNILWDTMDIHDTAVYTHDTTSNEHQVTVIDQGDYLLHYNDSLTGSNDRVSPIIKVQVNGVDVSGAESKTHYIRNTNNHNESSASLVFLLRNLSAGDVITVTVQRDVATNTVNDVEDALLAIIKK